MTDAALTGTPDPRRWPALTVSLVGAFMVLLPCRSAGRTASAPPSSSGSASAWCRW
jgi:hypothetical protein